MLTRYEATERAADLVAKALKAGADACDAIYSANASTHVQIRLGQLEDVDRSEGEEMSLRVFSGQRSASVSSSDLSAAALSALAGRAVSMAREAPEDPYAGLAPKDRLMAGPYPDLDIDDRVEVTPAALRAAALEAEDAARAVKGVTNSEGAGAGMSRAVYAMATSHGFAAGYTGSSHSVSASVLAGEGGGMQRDYAYHSTRHRADLDSPASIGARAGARAVARLDPVRIRSGTMPVVFDPRVGNSLLGHLAAAITGAAVARRTTFLLDSLGKPVFRPGVRIIDDPLRRRGLRSRPFDAEGLATAETVIVDDGVLTGWLVDSVAGRQLGLPPTGHAVRGGAGTTNLHLAPGMSTPGDLIADIRSGFYCTELIGQGVNGLTGDYSRGASGFMIVDGALAAAVSEVTIAGNLKDMFLALTPASDLRFRYGVNVPTLRIDGMMLAGE